MKQPCPSKGGLLTLFYPLFKGVAAGGGILTEPYWLLNALRRTRVCVAAIYNRQVVYKQIRDSGKGLNDATFTNVICYTAG